MGSEWKQLTLGDVVTLKRGYDLPSQHRLPGPFPIVSSSGISGSHNEAKVDGPGVITGRYGTIGQVHFVEEPYWPLNTTLYVQDFKGNHRRYVKYLLETIDYSQYSDKAAVPGVNRNHLHEAIVKIPALAEQERIAKTLAALDRSIDLLRQTNTTLEAIAQALFKSWFVDFDPVHAKAEGREPEGMNPATAALFPSEFEESELGLIPKGWGAVPLREAFEINPRRVLRKGAPAPYLDMASVQTSGHVPTPPIEREFSSGTKFQNGDTLLARITPCLENGKTAHVDFLEAEQIGWGSTEFIVLKPKGLLTPYFAYLLARQPEFRAFAIQAMTGTSGRQRVELGQLEQFRMTVPDDVVAGAFGSFIEPMRGVISGNAARMVTLAQLRDTLLPRLISGKLRLPDAEGAIESALDA